MSMQYVHHHQYPFNVFVFLSVLSFATPAPSLPNILSFHLVASAKSLQSCPTLCNPIDSSPLGSLVPGILQARTLEWVKRVECSSNHVFSEINTLQFITYN